MWRYGSFFEVYFLFCFGNFFTKRANSACFKVMLKKYYIFKVSEKKVGVRDEFMIVDSSDIRR